MVSCLWCYFRTKASWNLNNKTKAKILWDLNLTINAKDFDKDGRLEDIEKVETLARNSTMLGMGQRYRPNSRMQSQSKMYLESSFSASKQMAQ